MEILDHRGRLFLPGNQEETIQFALFQFIEIGKKAIQERGNFYVALSGGQTPNAIFKKLASPAYSNSLDWSRVFLFWSDERAVSPDDKESNYFNAMQADLKLLPLNPKQIFRMEGEKEIAAHAEKYEKLIKEKVPHSQFDLLMLGMGEDGHTASLFPETDGLKVENRLVIANYVPQKNVGE